MLLSRISQNWSDAYRKTETSTVLNTLKWGMSQPTSSKSTTYTCVSCKAVAREGLCPVFNQKTDDIEDMTGVVGRCCGRSRAPVRKYVSHVAVFLAASDTEDPRQREVEAITNMVAAHIDAFTDM